MSDSQPSRDADRTGVEGWHEPLPVDDRLELLTSSRRRAALRYLKDQLHAPVRMSALVDHLTSAGYGERKAVEISLQHVHLPKLASKGIIEYDSQRGLISYRPHEDLEELLSFVDEE